MKKLSSSLKMVLIFLFLFSKPALGCFGTVTGPITNFFFEDTETALRTWGSDVNGDPLTAGIYSLCLPFTEISPYPGGSIHISNVQTTEQCVGSIFCYYTVLAPYDIDFGQTCEDTESGQCPLDLNSDITPKCPLLGDPINILNGNNYEQEIDIRFPTVHQNGLFISRSYNSRSDVENSLGYGWRHNWNVSVSVATDISSAFLRVIDQTGRRYFYLDKNFNGTYVGFWRAPNTVVAQAGGGFVWQRSGSTYTFNSYGKLASLEDNQGNLQTLDYDENQRLVSVYDDASDLTLTFHYYANGKLEYISGPATEAVADGIWVRYEYDADNNLTRVIYADDGNGSPASGFEYQYDIPATHNLTAKLNLAGEMISTWQYDGADRAWQNIDREGKGITIDYSDPDAIDATDAYGVLRTYSLASNKGQKYIKSITGANGCASCSDGAVRWEYDGLGQIIEKEYANGRIDRFEGYDGNEFVYPPQKIINSNGTQQRIINRIYHNYYSKLPKVVVQTEQSLIGAGDKVTFYDFDSDGNSVANESPTLLVSRTIETGFTFDSTGSVVPYEYITVLERDDKGQVTSVNGPRPGDLDKVLYDYDQTNGNLISITYPQAGTISFDQYDAAGNLKQMTDLNGIVTTFAYDGRNRLLSFTRNGITTSLTYTSAGNPASVTDAAGRVLDYQYNSAGFLEKIVDPGGNYVFFDYSAMGKVTEQSNYSFSGIQTSYLGYDYGDPATNTDLKPGKPWKLIRRNHSDTADLETELGYDVIGNIDTVTDAKGNSTIYRYDSMNRLECVEQPGQVITEFEYDRHGNLISVTDPEGLVTQYLYDDMDRLVRADSPDTGIVIYAYDEAGNVKTENRNGKIISYTYDDLGRLTHIVYEDATQNVTLTYDTGPGANLSGRLASITDASGNIQYSYDANGFLETETKTIAGTTYVTDYEFDAAGNLKRMVYPTGQTIEYLADAADPATIGAVLLNPLGSNQTLTSGITYKPFGPVDSMALGNGISIARGYDKNYQMLSLAAGTIMDRTYTPDSVGNIEAITDNLDSPRSQSFGYDDLYRLTSASGIYGTVGYTYDNVGNRLTRTQTGQTTSQDNYSYYPGTNRLQTVVGDHAELFQYDADGNTTQRIPGAANAQPPITDPADYTYNSAGQRAVKDAINDVIYHYDLSAQLIAETDDAGTMLKAYIWLFGQPLAMISADGSVYFYHNDHLGTPQKMTDSSGALVWAADYLPFGQADVTIANVENNLRFAGQYYDAETGLHYNYHRYYDPSLGRYLRADPIGLAGGLNPYLYVQNNPVNWIDPLGLEADNLNPNIRNAVNVINIIDVLPIGMIPGAGPTVGEFLDISAFAGAQAILIRDVMAKDINGVQFFIGSTLNGVNVVLGTVGNYATPLGNLLLSIAEGGLLYMNYQITSTDCGDNANGK